MSLRVTRSDRYEVRESKIEHVAGGGIRVPCRASRVGVLSYTLDDGSTRREYRPPEEVFAAESLASFRDAPVTVQHPSAGEVDPSTWEDVAVGHVSGDATPEEDRFVLVSVVVHDAETIRGVTETKEIGEVSSGYTAELDPTPGTSPDGEEYDAIQRRIRYNHLALLRPGQGRAGPEVRILLDSKTSGTLPVMEKITIDGIEYVKGSPEHLAAVERQRDAAIKRADSAAAEAIRYAHRRADLVATLRAVTGNPRRLDASDPAAESTSNESIMAEILAKKLPGLDLSGRSPDFLMGALAAAMLGGEPAPMSDSAKPPPSASPDKPPMAGELRGDALEDLRRGDSGAVAPDAAAAAAAEYNARRAFNLGAHARKGS
jgi:uncharacterized protein